MDTKTEKLTLDIKDVCCALLDCKPEGIVIWGTYSHKSEEAKWFALVDTFKKIFEERFPDNKPEISGIFCRILGD